MMLQDEVLQVSLEDLQRSVNFHNEQANIGLQFHGGVAGGAAWSTGDFVITARATSATTTVLRVESVSGEGSPFGIGPWTRLRDVLQQEGIAVRRSQEEAIANMLIKEGMLERIANLPTDAHTEALYRERTLAEQAGATEEQLAVGWARHCKEVEEARSELARREELRREAVAEYLNRFYIILEANQGPPVPELTGPERELGWVGRTPEEKAQAYLQERVQVQRERQEVAEALQNLREADTAGQIVLSEAVNDLTARLDAGHLTPGAQPRYLFRIKPGTIATREIRFEGDAFTLPDTKGLRIIGWLLGSAGRAYHCIQLDAMGSMPPVPADTPRARERLEQDILYTWGGGQKKGDRQTLKEIEQQLRQNAQEREKAGRKGNVGWIARLDKEKEELEYHYKEYKQEFTSDRERARSNVRSVVDAALRNIRERDPELWKHLLPPSKGGHLTIGYWCEYNPGKRIPWRT